MMLVQKLQSLRQNKSLMNGALFSLFSFINRGFSFFLLMILANYITPAEYGYLSLFNTVVMVLSYFKAMSTEGYVSVAYFREGEAGLKNTVSCVFATSIIFTVVVIGVLLLLGESICSWLNLKSNILLLAVFIAFGTLYANINLDYLRVIEKIKLYGILSCTNALLNFILSILLVKVLAMGWEGRVYAQFASYVLFGLIGLIWLIKLGYVGLPKFSYWKTILIWGVPLIPHLATNFIRQGCDTYIINNWHSIEDVGIFNFAFTLSSIITMLGMGFNQSNSVEIYKVLGNLSLSAKEKESIITRQKKNIAGIYLASALLIAFSCYFIMPLVLPKYAASMNYFLILSLYALGVCFYFLYTNFLFYYKKTKTIMYVTFSSASLHLLLSLLFTRYSLYCTCSIYVITQLIVVFIIRYLANKEIRKELI